MPDKSMASDVDASERNETSYLGDATEFNTVMTPTAANPIFDQAFLLPLIMTTATSIHIVSGRPFPECVQEAIFRVLLCADISAGLVASGRLDNASPDALARSAQVAADLLLLTEQRIGNFAQALATNARASGYSAPGIART